MARTEELLTYGELAELLSVSPQTLRNWRRQGRGPRATKVGARLVRFHREDVDAWLEQQREDEPSEAVSS